jgi:hypothetical protein
MGLLSGLIFFTQQDQVLPLLPFLLYAFFTGAVHGYTALPKRAAALLLGFLSIIMPVCAYFFLNNSLGHFWESAFLFNFNWYNERAPLMQDAKAIRSALHYCEFDVIFYGGCILGVAALILGNKKQWLLLACLAAVVLSFCSEYLSGKLIMGLPVSYYFLALCATLPSLMFTVFAFSNRLFAANTYHQLVYGTILSANLLFHISQYAGNISGDRMSWIRPLPEYQYLKAQQLRDHELYIFYNSDYIYLYNEFKILSPSRWIYHYFWHWYGGWDPGNKKLQSITADLEKYRTLYILDFSDTATFKDSNNFIFWRSFLQQKYTPVMLTPAPQNVTLWKRRE